MIYKAVVPVAGLGTRMLPLTRSIPKEMLPLGRKPVIHHVVDELAAAGINRILFVTADHKQAIENYFQNGKQQDNPHRAGQENDPAAEDVPPALDYTFERQDNPAGNGDAVLRGKAFAESDPFVVAWGDATIQSREEGHVIRKMMDTHLERGADCTIAVEYIQPEMVSRYGIVQPVYESNISFPIEGIVEKPSAEDAPSRFAVSARYICDPSIFSALETTPRRNGELWLTDAIHHLIMEGKSVWCVPVGTSSHRYDIGTPPTYWEAFVHYAMKDKAEGNLFRESLHELLQSRNKMESN